MEKQCAYLKFIVALPSMEVAVSVAKALSSYTARVLIQASLAPDPYIDHAREASKGLAVPYYVQSTRPFASLTWPEQFTCLSLIDVPNRFANR